MSKKKTEFVFKPGALKNIASIVDMRLMAAEVKKVIESDVKPTIARGISPVRGERNFAKYKDKEKYPGDLKQSNKPNLNLTGAMLREYDARPAGKPLSVTMGVHRDAPEDIRARAIGNNFGTKSKGGGEGIPARPMVPGEGQEWTSKISVALRDALATVVMKAFKSLKGR